MVHVGILITTSTNMEWVFVPAPNFETIRIVTKDYLALNLKS